jgi:hypothetical protein
VFNSEAKALFDSSEPPDISICIYMILLFKIHAMHACQLLTNIFFVELDEVPVAMMSLGHTVSLSGAVHSVILCCARAMVSLPRVATVFRAKTVCLWP